MWTDRRQRLIYKTEWFGDLLVAFDRRTGRLKGVHRVGEAPAYVMLRAEQRLRPHHARRQGRGARADAGTQADQPPAAGAERRHAADRWRHDARLQQALRVELRGQLDQRGRHADRIVLPIQTPSPDGKYVMTANTLTATVTIADTDTDELVASLLCDAGCHG
jgi:hypothetical protein